ncbi:SRPBCC family protein [Kitasatospora sp. NPDC093558]|uniref:SRPBCC family protein n=1 Tax=Kitasatospora sp. NPDC093558 TaxID=3155201 RepID=UPI003429A0A4
MAVLNIHERTVPAPEETVGALLDGLAGPDDRLWPGPAWPRMRFDGPLAVGASGGHGPVRYTVVGYQPGRWVRFRFNGPRGFDGFHEFTVQPATESGNGGGTLLRHTIVMRAHGPARVSWPLAFRWLHDALLEDALDRAVRACGGTVATPARWTPYVRLLRALVHRRH